MDCMTCMECALPEVYVLAFSCTGGRFSFSDYPVTCMYYMLYIVHNLRY